MLEGMCLDIDKVSLFLFSVTMLGTFIIVYTAVASVKDHREAKKMLSHCQRLRVRMHDRYIAMSDLLSAMKANNREDFLEKARNLKNRN